MVHAVRRAGSSGIAVQDVPALAVRVVHDGVEDAHPAQVSVVGVHERRRPRRRDRGRRGPRASRPGRPAGHDVDEATAGDHVAAVRRTDPRLRHPLPERAVVAPDSRRDDVPAERRGDLVGRDLAQPQRRVREVPERPLARRRLVDAGDVHALELGAGQQRRVARVDEPALDGQGAPREDLEEIGSGGHRGTISVGSRWRAGRCGPTARAAGCRRGRADGRPTRRTWPAWRTRAPRHR